ncbi:MAG: glycerate kinase [Anaerolineales bacterium]
MSIELISPLPYSLQNHPYRDVLIQAIQAALAAVNGEEVVRQTLEVKDGRLYVGDQSCPIPPQGKIAILAVGKAATAMARGAKESLRNLNPKGIIVTKFHSEDRPNDFPILIGDHPIPRKRSLRAARAVERFLSNLNPEDILLCLISGGASALLTYPRPPLTLRDIQRTTQLLLQCGATIHELNTVRKHLERFKGGGIVQIAPAATVISLIISDVIGDAIEVIGSGLTAPDPTTFREALTILERYELTHILPPKVMQYLHEGSEGLHAETLKPQSALSKTVVNQIIASNRHACVAAQQSLQKCAVETLHLTSFLQGEASQVGRVFAAFARQLHSTRRDTAPPLCWIAGGETTVTVRGDGIGGRNSELALGAVLDMEGVDRTLLITLATDGDDGFSAAAGAVVNGATALRARQLRLSPADYLKRNDSFTFFSQLEDCLFLSPTQTNVNDLIFLFIG